MVLCAHSEWLLWCCKTFSLFRDTFVLSYELFFQCFMHTYGTFTKVPPELIINKHCFLCVVSLLPNNSLSASNGTPFYFLAFQWCNVKYPLTWFQICASSSTGVKFRSFIHHLWHLKVVNKICYNDFT